MANKKKVFVLDNDMDCLKRIQKVLGNEYEVSIAWDVLVGCSKLKAEKDSIDLIILDIMLSTDDQYDLIEAQGGIRTGILFFEQTILESIYKDSLEKLPPVIILTAYNGENDLELLGNNPHVKGIIMKNELNAYYQNLPEKIKGKLSGDRS